MITESPKTTIIIPTFNRSNLVTRAINSALNQTINCKVIVVDHGSIDNTEKVVAFFGEKVQYLKSEIDNGPIYSWLDGVINSRTEFVKILYDDDFLDPRYLEVCEPLLEEEVAFVFTKCQIINIETNNVVGNLFEYSSIKTGKYRTSSFFGLKIQPTMISPSAMLMRRTDVLEGLYLGKLPLQKKSYHGAGTDHFIKLNSMLKYNSFAYSDDLLSFFGYHPGSITINALQESSTRSDLNRVYRETWAHYRLFKLGKIFWPFLIAPPVINVFLKILAFFLRRVSIFRK